MATWDGSYSGSEDQQYYVYPDQNAAGQATKSWTYFPDNMSTGYLETNRDFYLQNGTVYEQNCPTRFYGMDNNISSGSSNLPALTNNYQEPVVPSIITDAQVPRNLEYFSNVAPYWNDNHAKRTPRNHKRSSFGDAGNAQPNIAGQSNLHAMASEFVPHNTKVSKDKGKLESNTQVYTEDSKLKVETTDTQFSYERIKNDRRYDNRWNMNYKHKEGQHGQFQKGNTFKNSSRQQAWNYNKFQGDRYPNTGRHRLDKAQEVNISSDQENTVLLENVKMEELCPSTSSDTSRSKKLTNGGGEDRSIGNRDDSQQSYKTRRHNNYKEYGYQNSGSSARQIHHRNNGKYPSIVKHDREDNGYKDIRRNYHGYNGFRENYKDDRMDAKEKMSSYWEHDGSREFYNRENKAEGKEKRYNYQGHNELREYHANEDTTENSKQNDKNRNANTENKERGTEKWRNKKEYIEKNMNQKRGQNKKTLIDDDASQRERLTDQLNKGQLECLVCCDRIKQNDYVWSCSNCYHVLHLKCVKKWATSSQGENGWRCPACQNVNLAVPEDCFCFCGKTKAPEWNRRDVAHSCGEICGRTLSKNTCPHKCTLLCHPGSCPLCISMVTKYCGCGKTSQTLQCSTHTLLLCDSVCGKDLNCGTHKCEKKCHHGECGRCESTVEQECYCGKNKRNVACLSNVSPMYCCENVCGRLLNCGIHTCEKSCHANDCEPCSLTPDKVTTCCCGQTPLSEKRETCLDPIPTCDKVCSKNLKCGQPNNPHTCKANCHEGKCPDCDLTTDVKCRCGNMDREIACKELTSKADDARCEKRCTKKRSCGKHKCNQLCCIDIEHTCPLSCSKMLTCGRHRCEQSCHKGKCQPCWRSSFEELYCECGAAVIYPPVPCGTRRPACDRPCSRPKTCGHEVLHNCHSEPTCPPCTVLTQRWCHGKHEIRKAVPCYVTEISCGLPCNKPLSCGSHKCTITCHPGACEKPGQQCSQPCTIPREMCGHICAAPCHEGKCPDTPCKEMVKVTCQCGHRSVSRVCAENSKEYQTIASSILASKMADMQLGHSINLEEVFGQGAKKQNQLKTLECNDECKIIERNRRLALGLQIVNPDTSGKLMPRYSDFMKNWAKKDPMFCRMVHDKLTQLVQLAKTSKQKSRSYSFDIMNKDKRHFVHESCGHFGCTSQAYDQEPKRNVVATAVKDKSWLPSYSLLEIVQRENGQRKVPGPMLSTSNADGSIKTVLSLPVRKSQKPATSLNSKTSEPEIDYFDFQG